MDSATLEKYRKVLLLAQQGATEGERKAAQSVLSTMERRYPGIGAEASAPPSPEPSGAFGFPPRGGSGFKPSGRADPPQEEGFIGSMWDFLRNAAAGLREGMSLRERVVDVVEIETRVNSRTARFTVSIPLAELLEVYEEFGDEKTPEIATIIASMVRDELIETLSMGLEEPL